MYTLGLPRKTRKCSFHIKFGSYKYMHDHKDFWEFMLITSGNYVHRINGESIKLEPKTLCVIRPFDTHSIIAEKEKSSSHVNVCVSETFLKEILALSSGNMYDELYNCKKPISFALSPLEADELVKESNSILLKDKHNSGDAILAMILSIFKIMLLNGSKEDEVKPSYGKIVLQLINLISNPDNLQKSLKEIIAMTKYSYNHANRVFLNETKQSLFSYLHVQKMLYARRLLTTTDYTLDTIAQKLGYSTAYAFSSSFKKLVGVSPSIYAKTHQSDYVVVSGDNESTPDDI